MAGESLAGCVLPEVVVGLGTIPTLNYTGLASQSHAALGGVNFGSNELKGFDGSYFGNISSGDFAGAMGKLETHHQ